MLCQDTSFAHLSKKKKSDSGKKNSAENSTCKLTFLYTVRDVYATFGTKRTYSQFAPLNLENNSTKNQIKIMEHTEIDMQYHNNC